MSLKNNQVWLVVKGFETDHDVMYAGNIITIKGDGKLFSFTVPVEGNNFNSSFTFDLYPEFEQALVENGAILREDLSEALPGDVIQIVENGYKYFLSHINGDKFIAYEDHLVKCKVKEKTKFSSISLTELLNEDSTSFLRPQSEVIEEGDVVIEVGGGLESRGSVSEVRGGKVEVITNRANNSREWKPLSDFKEGWFIKVPNTSAFYHRFKTKEAKPELLLFSESTWYES